MQLLVISSAENIDYENDYGKDYEFYFGFKFTVVRRNNEVSLFCPKQLLLRFAILFILSTNGKPDALSRKPQYLFDSSDDISKYNYLQLFRRIDNNACAVTICSVVLPSVNCEGKNENYETTKITDKISKKENNEKKKESGIYKREFTCSAISILSSDLTFLSELRESVGNSDKLVEFNSKKLNNNWTFEDGILFYKDLIWLPTEEFWILVFNLRHGSLVGGHFGTAKTVELISRDFYWEGMRKSIRRFIRNCDACQRAKPSRHAPYGLLQALPVPDGNWKDISVDFIGELPESGGYNAVMVVKDRLSKMAHFVAVRTDIDAEEMARVFRKSIFRLHGVPRSIVSDRGSQFISNFWKRFTALRLICLLLITRRQMVLLKF